MNLRPPNPLPPRPSLHRKARPLRCQTTPFLPTQRRNPANIPAVEIAGDAGVAVAVTIKTLLRTNLLPPKRSLLPRRPKLQHPNPKNPCSSKP